MATAPGMPYCEGMDGSAAQSSDVSRRAVIIGALGALGWWFGTQGVGLIQRGSRAPAPPDDLGPPDAYGVRVLPGFTSMLIGRSGDVVAGTNYVWHDAPDGGGCIALPDGGHVYVSNSEVAHGGGGVGVVRFDADDRLVDAVRLLRGTSRNCGGGVTPWGTWLSCEENGATGIVWECDPRTGSVAARTELGSFNHEAVAVDEVRACCYLTEDDHVGRLYRFVPDHWPDLSSGTLEAARVDDDHVSWIPTSANRPDRSMTTTPFDGGEGIAVDQHVAIFTTKGDRRVWQLDLRSGELRVHYDARSAPASSALTHVDNVTVHPATRDVFVAEDRGNVELCRLHPGRHGLEASPVVRFEGNTDSEVAGPAFSPDGRHLYVSSQRGVDGRGLTVRITGPWDRVVAQRITDETTNV